MANPIATDQATVLQAVVTRLIARLGTSYGLNDANCFVSASPEVLDPNSSHQIIVTVCPLESQFDESALTGAGEFLCIEQAGVVITPHTAVKLDQVERIDQALLHATLGLLGLKKAILKAMKTTDRLQDDAASPHELLVNLMHPLHGSRPEYNEHTSLTRLSVTFSTDFQWDLS